MQKKRSIMADMRLLVKRRQLYTYPDVMAICGPQKYAPGRMYVERHRPLGLGRWEMTAFETPDDVLALASVGIELTLAGIYEGVELES
jgi:hypothetical protein